MKYRLNIPDEIPKKLAHSASCLEWFDGKILTLFNKNESSVRYDCENRTYNSIIPPEWIEEIKPVVLSVQEIADQHDMDYEDCHDFGNHCDINGQLKKYLEFKKEFEKNQRDGHFQNFAFKQALKNLEPLEQ